MSKSFSASAWSFSGESFMFGRMGRRFSEGPNSMSPSTTEHLSDLYVEPLGRSEYHFAPDVRTRSRSTWT